MSFSDFSKYYLAEEAADVTIKLVEHRAETGPILRSKNNVAENTAIPAHSLLLCTRSAYFEARLRFEDSIHVNLNGDGSGRKELVISLNREHDGNGDANGPTCIRDTFMALLKFIYSGEIALSADNIVDVLYAADFFQVRSLLDHCVRAFETSLLWNRAWMPEQEPLLREANVLAVLARFRRRSDGGRRGVAEQILEAEHNCFLFIRNCRPPLGQLQAPTAAWGGSLCHKMVSELLGGAHTCVAEGGVECSAGRLALLHEVVEWAKKELMASRLSNRRYDDELMYRKRYRTRAPRLKLSREQVTRLEELFNSATRYPGLVRTAQLAADMGVERHRLMTWFKNRRAKARNLAARARRAN